MTKIDGNSPELSVSQVAQQNRETVESLQEKEQLELESTSLYDFAKSKPKGSRKGFNPTDEGVAFWELAAGPKIGRPQSNPMIVSQWGDYTLESEPYFTLLNTSIGYYNKTDGREFEINVNADFGGKGARVGAETSYLAPVYKSKTDGTFSLGAKADVNLYNGSGQQTSISMVEHSQDHFTPNDALTTSLSLVGAWTSPGRSNNARIEVSAGLAHYNDGPQKLDGVKIVGFNGEHYITEDSGFRVPGSSGYLSGGNKTLSFTAGVELRKEFGDGAYVSLNANYISPNLLNSGGGINGGTPIVYTSAAASGLQTSSGFNGALMGGFTFGIRSKRGSKD